ncbi:MAG: type III pantothenate kinase, partial [Planctomycetota bacterium]|nr:type III pantothenate kinase [Planctomycetota bacterium]
MSPDLLLTVDVGNTRAKLGLFDRNAWSPGVPLPPCLATQALPLAQPLELRSVAEHLAAAHGPILQTAVAGVNPPGIDRLLAGWPQAWPRPRRITSHAQVELRVDVETPERVGIDRLLGAVAANRLRTAGQGAIVVDSGTATTVNLITPLGEFAGGAILPGLSLCGLALNHYTAMLPHVPASELVEGEIPPVGKNTWDAIRSGVLY